MSLSRHEKRAIVIQTLFLMEGQHKDPHEALKYVSEQFGKAEDTVEFEKSLVDGVIANLKAIKKKITVIAPEWPLERISPVDRALLYLSIYEMMFTETPNPVVINEAVDLTKEFGGEHNYKFINGALSSLNKELEKKKKSRTNTQVDTKKLVDTQVSTGQRANTLGNEPTRRSAS